MDDEKVKAHGNFGNERKKDKVNHNRCVMAEKIFYRKEFQK